MSFISAVTSWRNTGYSFTKKELEEKQDSITITVGKSHFS